MQVNDRGKVRWGSPDWEILPVSGTRKGSRTGATPDPLIAQLEEHSAGKLELERAYAGTPNPLRGKKAGSEVQAAVKAGPGHSYVFAVRHPSGAMTFHLPQAAETSARGIHGPRLLHFSIAASNLSTRGPAGAAVKFFLLRILARQTSKHLPALSREWERRRWVTRKRQTGWMKVTSVGGQLALEALTERQLARSLSKTGRNLLLIHGILSDAETAFRFLAHSLRPGSSSFLDEAANNYDGVFAFNHFTVSTNPEQNARDLLTALPRRVTTFDVVTHSRGGIVLRHLSERSENLGSEGSRFALRHAVLVASPNQGSPLASPARLITLLSWTANILELFPDNPLTFGLEFVAEGLAWLAENVPGALPGVAALAPSSSAIAELQTSEGKSDRYSALVSNYEPDRSMWLRMIDVGVDQLFGSANDLVVPTEGGWRTSNEAGSWIAKDRIGCFGRKGNFAAAGNGAVNHVTFFDHPEVIRFILAALRGELQLDVTVDPRDFLPFRSAGAQRDSAFPSDQAGSGDVGNRARTTGRGAKRTVAVQASDDVFQLMLLSATDTDHLLVARFRNASVSERFQTAGGEAGKRMHRIIAMHERIKRYLDGTPSAGSASPLSLPRRDELLTFGSLLFSTLFPPEIRRLYDSARASQTRGKLNLIFTSNLSWIADKPWEFAFDPARKTFLATEDANFTRNVFTAVPGEIINPLDPPLSILVAIAQPSGTAFLSSEEEEEVIQGSFQPLIDAGLARVSVLRAVTPAILHRELSASQWDVVHFIGHGEYDVGESSGSLLFENENGKVQKVHSRALRELFCNRGVRLVFLNACETGRGGRTEFNGGAAPALVAAGIPAVVANQYTVLDSSATAFARSFYQELASGSTLGDAAREARIAVNYQINGTSIDWAVPVLYARDPSDRLCRRSRR